MAEAPRIRCCGFTDLQNGGLNSGRIVVFLVWHLFRQQVGID